MASDYYCFPQNIAEFRGNIVKQQDFSRESEPDPGGLTLIH
jgi:hypothetical protein